MSCCLHQTLLPSHIPPDSGLHAVIDIMMQACVWTGSATCDAASCKDRCLANLYPGFAATPIVSGIGWYNDAFHDICPELTLVLERVASGFYLNGPDSTSGGATASRRLLDAGSGGGAGGGSGSAPGLVCIPCM